PWRSDPASAWRSSRRSSASSSRARATRPVGRRLSSAPRAMPVMSDRRRSRTVLAVLVLVSLLLLTLDYRQGDGGAVAILQRGALAVFAPVQEGLASVVRPIGGFFSSIGELGSLR